MKGKIMSVDVNGNYNTQVYAPQYAQRVQYARRPVQPQFGQGEADSFEHSSGGGLGKGLLYTGLGTFGAGATGYFLNGNPISESEGNLKINEKFYTALDNAMLESKITKAISAAELKAIKDAGISSKEELEALKKLAAAENIESLSEEAKKALPKNITTPEAANNLVQKAETALKDLDKNSIATKAKETYLKETKEIKYSDLPNKIKNLTSVEEGLKALKDDVKPDELKNFITDNKELFGIKGDEAAVTSKIEEMSKLGKKDLLKMVTEAKLDNQKALEYVDKSITKHISKETKALAEGAPEYLKNAFKEFKWSQAKTMGMWGAATGFGLYLLSSIFGGSSKS